MSYEKPLPLIDLWNGPFWEGCKAGKLMAQKCDQSGEIWLPPSPISPVTRTDAWSWVELSGQGRVWSWVVMHQRYFKSFSEDLPYNIAQVELEEGPMLISNIVGVANEDIQAGMPVQAVFEDVTDEFTLPRFTPVL